jgi:hypothetical protein
MATKPNDVRAGGAYVEVSLRDRLTKGLASLQTRIMAISKTMMVAGRQLGKLAVIAAIPQLAAFFGGLVRAERMENMAIAMGKTTEEMQRLAYAAEVAGVAIDDVVKDPQRFAGLLADAPIMDAGQIRDSVSVLRDFRKILIDVQVAFGALAKEAAPLAKWLSVVVRENSHLVAVVAAATAGLLALAGMMMVVGGGVASVITIMGGLVSAISAVSVAIGAVLELALPFAPIIALVVALTAAVVTLWVYFLRMTDAGRALFDAMFIRPLKILQRVFATTFDVFRESFGGIVAAIKKGDFEQAWIVVKAGFFAVLADMELKLTTVWVAIKDRVVESWHAAIDEVKRSTMELMKWIASNDPTGLLGVGNGDAFEAAADAIDADAIRDKDERRKIRDDQVAAAEKKLADARKELAIAVAKANEKAAENGPAAMAVKQSVTATIGAFRLTRDARQMFGGPEKELLAVNKNQLEELEKINEGVAGLAGIFRLT